MKLTSREYKLMLRSKLFNGDASARSAAVHMVWRTFKDIVADRLVDAPITLGKGLRASARRDILFLDTAGTRLASAFDLVLRLRRPCDTGDNWSSTLKFRHGDRLLSGGLTFRPRRSMADGDRPVKFEEDVKATGSTEKPAFCGLFSRSAEARINDAGRLTTIGRLRRAYARLPEGLDRFAGEDLVPVGGLSIVEEVFDGGTVMLAGTKAEAAVILWSRSGSPDLAIAAEFSFRFKLDKGKVDPAVARSAWMLFGALNQHALADPAGPTKTALVYGAGNEGTGT